MSLKNPTNTIIAIIRKVQTHWVYSIIYYIIYAYMMMNDSVKLYFFPSWADIAFNSLTVLSVILYIIDIIFRSIQEQKYFLRFFFIVDVGCVFLILGSAFIENISYWITLSFLKILMVVKITNIIFAYKEFMRKRKIKKKLKNSKKGGKGSSSLLGSKGAMAQKKKQ